MFSLSESFHGSVRRSHPAGKWIVRSLWRWDDGASIESSCLENLLDSRDSAQLGAIIRHSFEAHGCVTSRISDTLSAPLWSKGPK